MFSPFVACFVPYPVNIRRVCARLMGAHSIVSMSLNLDGPALKRRTVDYLPGNSGDMDFSAPCPRNSVVTPAPQRRVLNDSHIDTQPTQLIFGIGEK